MILVSMNYRLNAFGFLSLNTTEVSGNQGLRDQQLLFSTCVDQDRTALIIPTTIMGPLESCVPMLTMAAAREDPQQDAHGTPCMPKPRRQLSLRLIMTTLSALDIYPPTRRRRLGSAFSSKSRNPRSAPSRIQTSGLRSRSQLIQGLA